MHEHILYGYKGSGSAAVEAALVIAGVPHRIVDAASWDDKSALDDLERVNPLMQIPTLQLPGGAVMSESAAILMHLGLEHPASGLLPGEPSARAQAIRGLVYIAANCYSAIGICDYPERYCEPCDDDTRKRIIAGTRARLHAMWDCFADIFRRDTPFLGGARPGALDLLAGVVSKWSGARAHLQTARPDFHALLQRIERDARIAPVFERHWPREL